MGVSEMLKSLLKKKDLNMKIVVGLIAKGIIACHVYNLTKNIELKVAKSITSRNY